MRIAVLVLAAAACGSHPESSTQDGSSCPAQPVGYLLCKDSCGNGSVDECLAVRVDSTGCPAYSFGHESCDGNLPSCTAFGYFGGGGACQKCQADLRSCDPCPPGEVCGRFEDWAVAAGTAPTTMAGTLYGSLNIYDVSGTALVTTARYNVVPGDARGLVAVPGGWLVISRTLGVTQVTDAGVATQMPPLVPNEASDQVSATYAAGRVLVVWTSNGVHAAVTDESGALVAGPMVLSTSLDSPSVATDGAAFFVAVPGQLMKIVGDGTIAATTAIGVGTQTRAEVSCAATTCWYVAATSMSFDAFTAQRFDADAAALGVPITIAPGFAVSSFLADGDGLLGLEVPIWPNARIELVRFDASGAAVSKKAVAASSPGRLFRVGAQIGARFHFESVDFVAVTTPP